MDELLNRIEKIEQTVAYNTKLLEELTLSTQSKKNTNAAVRSQVEMISKMFSEHPAVKNDPQISAVMDQLSNVFKDVG